MSKVVPIIRCEGHPNYKAKLLRWQRGSQEYGQIMNLVGLGQIEDELCVAYLSTIILDGATSNEESYGRRHVLNKLIEISFLFGTK
jgi:hypothetical protein